MIRWCARQLSQESESAGARYVPQAEAIGFTEAVRQVLSTYRIGLSPVAVRDLLPTVGFETSLYHEPLPSIHVILKRLVSRGEVTQNKLPSGVTVYVWSSSIEEVSS
jgi:hypothetical protein